MIKLTEEQFNATMACLRQIKSPLVSDLEFLTIHDEGSSAIVSGQRGASPNQQPSVQPAIYYDLQELPIDAVMAIAATLDSYTVANGPHCKINGISGGRLAERWQKAVSTRQKASG